MSIKITKDNLTLEVETEAELRTVLSVLGGKRQGISLNPRDFVVDTDALVEIYRNIPVYSKSHEALNVLRRKPDGVAKTDLLKELGLESVQALGGVFGGIGRKAKELGVDVNDIYKWEFVDGNDVYKLTDNMAKAIDSFTKQEGE